MVDHETRFRETFSSETSSKPDANLGAKEKKEIPASPRFQAYPFPIGSARVNAMEHPTLEEISRELALVQYLGISLYLETLIFLVGE